MSTLWGQHAAAGLVCSYILKQKAFVLLDDNEWQNIAHIILYVRNL